MKISRYAGLAGIAFLSLVGLALAQTGTLYQTTPAPKIVHPYWSGLKVATDSDTPLSVTLTDTALSIPAGVSATLTDTSIDDGGGSITIDGSVTATIADSTLTDTWYDLTLTDTATEYSFTLPTNCVGYEFQCRTAKDVQWGNTAEVATTYWTLKSGTAYSTWPLANYNHSGKTLYFYSPTTAGLVIEIHAIIKP